MTDGTESFIEMYALGYSFALTLNVKKRNAGLKPPTPILVPTVTVGTNLIPNSKFLI